MRKPRLTRQKLQNNSFKYTQGMKGNQGQELKETRDTIYKEKENINEGRNYEKGTKYKLWSHIVQQLK